MAWRCSDEGRTRGTYETHQVQPPVVLLGVLHSSYDVGSVLELVLLDRCIDIEHRERAIPMSATDFLQLGSSTRTDDPL
jgi:hypothetical protein